MSRTLLLALLALCSVLCQLFHNAHLLAASTSSYCWTHEPFDTDSPQLYWDDDNQLLQGIGAVWPNISWYSWYPVVEYGVALYTNIKVPR